MPIAASLARAPRLQMTYARACREDDEIEKYNDATKNKKRMRVSAGRRQKARRDGFSPSVK